VRRAYQRLNEASGATLSGGTGDIPTRSIDQ